MIQTSQFQFKLRRKAMENRTHQTKTRNNLTHPRSAAIMSGVIPVLGCLTSTLALADKADFA